MINIVIPYHEMEFTFARSGGPGGQNVNKTNSAAILRWNLFNSTSINEDTRARLLEKLQHKLTKEGDIIVRSETQRDQDQNKSECIKKLHELLQRALFVPRKRVATKPTRSSVRKRLNTKKVQSEKKDMRKKVY
ncbi:Peptidyl-tRNA hydrolase ArfB [compost metagenome]